MFSKSDLNAQSISSAQFTQITEHPKLTQRACPCDMAHATPPRRVPGFTGYPLRRIPLELEPRNLGTHAGGGETWNLGWPWVQKAAHMVDLTFKVDYPAHLSLHACMYVSVQRVYFNACMFYRSKLYQLCSRTADALAGYDSVHYARAPGSVCLESRMEHSAGPRADSQWP